MDLNCQELINERKLLDWMRTELQANFLVIEELVTGAAYCQILDKIKPGIVDLSRVAFECDTVGQFRQNFAILEQGLKDLGIQQKILDIILPKEQLMSGDRPNLIRFTARMLKLRIMEKAKAPPTQHKDHYNALERRQQRRIRIGRPERRCVESQTDPDLLDIEHVLTCDTLVEMFLRGVTSIFLDPLLY